MFSLHENDPRLIFSFCALQGVRTPILQLSAMQEGDYTFQLTVTDSAGQQDTAQVTVIVQPGKRLCFLGHLFSHSYRELTYVFKTV